MKDNGIKQIALKAGVSASTVSRVLNNRPGIPKRTRQRILKIAEAVHYRGIPGRRTVAVLLHRNDGAPDIYTFLMMQSLANVLQREKYRVLYLYENDVPMLNETMICGGISLVMFGRISKEWAALKTPPLVCINDYDYQISGIPSVCSDDAECMEKLLKDFRRKGYTQIALIFSNPDTLSSQCRIQAFQKNCSKFGMTPHLLETGLSSMEQCYEELLVGLTDDITAVISATERYYPCVASVIEKKNPKPAFAAWAFPTADSKIPSWQKVVIQNYAGIAEAAVKMLGELVNERRTDNQQIPYLFMGPAHE